MKYMRHRHPAWPVLLAMLLPATSCEHKPLWIPETPIESTEVEYDWSECRYANPEGMSLYLYSITTGEPPWIYNLDPRGGIIEVPEGSYRTISFNNDTRGIQFRNTGDFDKIEVYTRPGGLLDGLDMPYDGTMPSRSVEEPVVITPDMMWTCASTIDINGKRITLTPRQLTPVYRFTVTEVTNLSGVAYMCASLSGLTGAIYLNTGESSSYPVTLPSSAKATGEKSIGGSLITFGIPNSPSAQNILSIYIWLNDGSKHMFNFDVTEQIRDAAEPLDVNITVAGLELPEINTKPDPPPGGGIGVDVDTWHIVDIELKPFD